MLAYKDAAPAVSQISAVSTKSNRTYIRASQLCKLSRIGRSATIVSTSKGLMLGKEACRKNLGGELLV